MSTGGAIIGGSLISGFLGNKAAKEGAQASSAASEASIAEQRRQFDIIQGQSAPYRGVGKEALYSLADMMGIGYGASEQPSPVSGRSGSAQEGVDKFLNKLGMSSGGGGGGNNPLILGGLRDSFGRQGIPGGATPSPGETTPERAKYDFTASPGYDFRRDEGQKALERSQAGRTLGGRAAKEMERYGQDYASSEFGNAFSRLSTMAGFGPPTIGAGMPTGIPGTMERAGAAQGQFAGQGAAATNNAIQGGLSNYMSWQQYNQGGGYDPRLDTGFGGGY